MNSAQFDHYADDYLEQHARNLRISGETPEFFARYKVQDVARQCAALRPRRILDFGCGIGSSVPHFHGAFPFARLVCLDVSERSLAIARQRYPNLADYNQFNGVSIPYANDSFEIAFAACVFHHIDEPDQVPILRELHRVLANDGYLFIFEHNPLNPLTRHAVNTCLFDENAVLIGARTLRNRMLQAGFRRVRIVYRVFFPAALKALRPLERGLGRLPIGAQYCLCAHG